MTRIEHDFIGDLEVPANAYYGVQSLRGKENFLKEQPGNLLHHRFCLCQKSSCYGEQRTRRC